MRFDELAGRAGRAAADAGSRAERPSFDRLRRESRRRTLVLAGVTSALAIMVVAGIALVLPGSESTVPVGAVGTTTTSEVATTTTELVNTTTLPDPTTTLGVVGDRESCPVTTPGPSPFVPMSSMPEGPPAGYGSIWFGTPALWTMIDTEGVVWEGLPVGADGSLTQKLFWWSDDFDIGTEQAPAISVTIEPQDGSGSPVVVAGNPGTNGSHPDLGSFMLVGVEIPGEGCWMITAEYRETSLSYVAWAGGR